MLRMISLEMDQIEEIQREFNGGAINLEDIENRQIATCLMRKSFCQSGLIFFTLTGALRVSTSAFLDLIGSESQQFSINSYQF